MSGTIINRLLSVAGSHQAINQPRRETVAATDSIKNFHSWSLDRNIKLSVGPAQCCPVVDRSRFHATHCCCDGLKIWKLADRLIDHFRKALDRQISQILVNTFHVKPQTGSEIFFVADHDIDQGGDGSVRFLASWLTAVIFPQRRSEIQIIRSNRAVLLGCRQRFLDHVRSRI